MIKHVSLRRGNKAISVPWPLVRIAHILADFHFVLPTEPLSQPFGRVRIDRRISRSDLPEGVVVRTAGQHPVQAAHHILRGHQPVSCSGLRTDLAAVVGLVEIRQSETRTAREQSPVRPRCREVWTYLQKAPFWQELVLSAPRQAAIGVST